MIHKQAAVYSEVCSTTDRAQTFELRLSQTEAQQEAEYELEATELTTVAV
jgi:hypothetical protein